jgi:hypothetical protein
MTQTATFELQTPVFPHDPKCGIHSSAWTNDCWGQGTGSDFPNARDAREAADVFMAHESGYVRIVNVQTGEVEEELEYRNAVAEDDDA